MLVDRLESTGLLEHVRDGHDRRRLTVRMLPHAVELLFDTWAPIARAMDDVSHHLTPAQQHAVCSFLDDITAIIKEAAAPTRQCPRL